jgi:hypothetical protein
MGGEKFCLFNIRYRKLKLKRQLDCGYKKPRKEEAESEERHDS